MGLDAGGGAGDRRPLIVAVDDDDVARERLRDELGRRYDRDYLIVVESSPRAGLALLEAAPSVAVVLAAQWMAEMNGSDLLARVKARHPRTKRALLISWGEWGHEPTAAAIRDAIASGCIDYYLLKPWRTPDETFHRTMAEFLHEWRSADGATPNEVVVLAERGSPRGHELRSLLTRNGVPHAFVASDSPEGEERLAAAGHPGVREPLVVLLGGRVLVDPTNAEVAEAYGVTTTLAGSCEFDVAVVGAGPAGLAAAVYGSSEGLSTIVIEREAIGGQAGSSSMIRNYLGFARGVGGAELAQRAYQQAWVFGTRFLLMREVTGLRCEDDAHTLTTSDGTEITARAVVLATGVTYRRLGIPALEELVGRGVFYGASPAEAKLFEGRRAYLVGAGNSAGQAALHLAKWADAVTLVVRGESLEKSMSKYLIDEIAAASNVDVLLRTNVVDGGGNGRLESLTLADDDARSTVVPADALFVLIGARPHTDWLPPEIARDAHGFVVAGAADLAHDELLADWLLPRPPLNYETCVPGVFAVGDVRSRSMKRVASSVGEGSGAIKEVHRYLESREKWAALKRAKV